MKDILILADFLGPLDGTFNSRFLYLADLLSKENEVEIVSSDFDHGSKTYFTHEIEKHDYKITLLHEGAYKTNVCIRRFFAHYRWGLNVKEYLKKRKKPDVIYCAIPTLKASLEAGKYCEKNGIRFVIDIQDLWPEAFEMIVNIPIINSIVFLPFRLIAKGIYKRADSICAVSDTYCQRALKDNRKCTEATVVFLGTELARYDQNASIKLTIEKKEGDIWLAYCGTLGSSYDLTCVIDALAILHDDRLIFVVMGDGPRRSEFENYAKKKKVKANFLGRIPYENMCSVLSACDITVNPITHLAAQSIINKHADYAASGLPVISTQENTEYKRLVDEYCMGYNCKNGDAEELAERLKYLVYDENQRKEMGSNARKCAEERFDRKKTYQLLMSEILSNESKAQKE